MKVNFTTGQHLSAMLGRSSCQVVLEKNIFLIIPLQIRLGSCDRVRVKLVDMMFDLLFVLVLILLQLNSVETNTSCSLIMTINKQGFHRTLSNSVLLVLPTKSVPEQSQCMVVLKEVLPRGAYIDPYQIHRIKDIQIAFQSEVDIEKPEYLSPQQTLLVYLPLLSTSKTGYLKAESVLPFHLRYHQPQIGDYSRATVNINPPTHVFTNCSDGFSALEKIPCSSSDSRLCLWQKLNCKAATVTTNVPVGDFNHLIPVSVITILSTFGSTALLLHQMYKTSNVKLQKQ